MGALFDFDGVSVRHGSVDALHDLSMTIDDDGVTALVGPSGAGKSTLLRLCNRLEVPDEGVVRFRGDDVQALDPLDLRRRVGMVFQRPVVFPGTIANNLHEAVSDADDGTCLDVLRRVGLDVGLDRIADRLSGGEMQRLSIARTLLNEPEVLLLDEPTSALDPERRLEIEDLVRTIADQGMAAVWVTHDLDQAKRVADHTMVLIEGRLGTGKQLDRYLTQDRPGPRVAEEGGAAGSSPGQEYGRRGARQDRPGPRVAEEGGAAGSPPGQGGDTS